MITLIILPSQQIPIFQGHPKVDKYPLLWMRTAFDSISLLIHHSLDGHSHITAVRLHHLDGISNAEFIPLLKAVKSGVIFTADQPQVCVRLNVCVAVIDLGIFIRPAVEKSRRILAVSAFGNLLPVVVQTAFIKGRILKLIINGLAVSTCHICHIKGGFHASFHLKAVNACCHQIRNMIDHAKVFGI